MKILRITTLLDFGGQEKKYISFTEPPEFLKNEYVFAAIGYGGNAENILKKRGFEVYILNRNFSIKNFSNIWAVYKLIRKLKPDVVHTAAAEANFHGIIAAKLAGVKTIIGEEIGISNHSSIAKVLFKQVYKLANNVICVSESVKTHLIQIGELKDKKGVVIYNPVSIPQKFDKEKSNLFNIVYVGRLEKVKNVKTLIDSFSQLTHPDTRLIIVGDGREKEDLVNQVNEKNLGDKVDFIGFTDVPSEYLSSADLFVLPSFSEGFGIAAVEAMFMKIPVLCSNVGGIPEFIVDNENGWLFNPNKQEELTSKLQMVLALSEEQRKEIGEQGFQDVIDKFTVRNYITNLEKLYAKN